MLSAEMPAVGSECANESGQPAEATGAGTTSRAGFQEEDNTSVSTEGCRSPNALSRVTRVNFPD